MKLLNLNDCGIIPKAFGRVKKENKEELNQGYKEIIDDLDSLIKSVEQTDQEITMEYITGKISLSIIFRLLE